MRASTFIIGLVHDPGTANGLVDLSCTVLLSYTFGSRYTYTSYNLLEHTHRRKWAGTFSASAHLRALNMSDRQRLPSSALDTPKIWRCYKHTFDPGAAS